MAADSSTDADRVRSIGLAYRSAMLYVPAWWLVSVPAGARLLSYGVWLLLPVMAYLAFRLARALEIKGLALVLLSLASAAGLLGLIPFVYLSVRANRALRRAGIRVGLLGPRKADLPVSQREAAATTE
jgi:hypothetical protein